MDLITAESLLGDVITERGLDHRRPARKQVTDVLDHYTEVRQRRINCRQARDRAEHRGDDGHLRKHPDLRRRVDVAIREIGSAKRLKSPDAAAGSIKQLHKWQAPLDGARARRQFLAKLPR